MIKLDILERQNYVDRKMISSFQGFMWMAESMKDEVQGIIFRAVKLFCTIVYRWIHEATLYNNPYNSTAQTVKLNA